MEAKPAGIIPVYPDKVTEVLPVTRADPEVTVAVPVEPEEAVLAVPAVIVPKGAATGVDVLLAAGATAADGTEAAEVTARCCRATFAW